MISCGDCGRSLTGKTIKNKSSSRVEYLCKSYMHHGKDFCPSYCIRESEPDARVQRYAEEMRNRWTAEQTDLRRLHRLWEIKRPVINSHIADLYNETQLLEPEIDDLMLEKIQNSY